ncbi:MAG: enoyl-CoA hydratase/isomerase family protein [Haloarculaceae archaeon]
MVDSGTETVAVEETDAVVTLRLNRPDKLNALGAEPIRGLRTALSALADDDRAVLVTGAGRATCAGMDTDLVGDGNYPEAHPDVHEALREAYRLLTDRTAPTGVAGHGVLVGAGFSLSLRTDFLVVGRETTLSLPEIRYDIPVLENARTLAEYVGPRVAKEIALTGRELDPDRLAALGLVNAVVPGDEVEATAHDLLAEIAGYDADHVAEVLADL